MGRTPSLRGVSGRQPLWCRDVSLRDASGRGEVSSEYHEDMLEVLTAAAAVVAAITGLWNTVQIGRLSGRLDTLTTQVNAHVNAPGLHTH